MDKIFVQGMEFYGYHGAFPEENKLGQRFFADVTLEMDTREAGENDDLNKTVNYAEVYEAAKEVLEGEPVKLVETLTARLANILLERFQIIDACVVKVTKPDPPIPGHYDSVAVEIRREQKGG
ncbi:dihydroneopterin aldolase [Salipaludibacillus aurantiacus]|uniref:7,8-dihydroneopterin aldolase n=1 Tax=Salipaludibacillus aurantiacus TaxID=1601833 RepID=A0A1H9X4H6_9BACI|nr:dihydroneopterin aldolase [Salipaludibacillus aurantiacus]SES40979.1 dihydroneopterin aldolase [Salipaludibacillus aurantiacus]